MVFVEALCIPLDVTKNDYYFLLCSISGNNEVYYKETTCFEIMNSELVFFGVFAKVLNSQF